MRLFSDLTLASLLAEGNVPALAKATDLEVVVLTASSDQEIFEAEPAFQSLAKLAPVRFIAIDDLIPGGLYGITLTLGYLRGMAAMRERMANTCFVFLNADLVLADGSLGSLAKRILRGERAILACSIRSISEELEPKLRALVDERCILAVPPRTLVGLAMQAMHSTQIAKIVNNDLCHSKHVNQFYWQVDDTTLVSRHFLMFMLCVRPERAINEVHAFCDYSFIPEMCPTSHTSAMEDSDEFFFVEMQGRESERNFLGLGHPDIGEIADSLSAWTTAQHRENSLKHSLIFHAGDLPQNLQASVEDADRYIRAIHVRLKNPPQPFRHHPYWTGTFATWMQSRGGQKNAVPLGRGIFTKLFGRPPRVSILHPEWADYRGVAQCLSRHPSGAGSRILYIKEGFGWLGSILGDVEVVPLGEVLGSSLADEGPSKVHLVVVELQRSQMGEIRRVIEILRPRLADGGEIVVFIKTDTDEGAMLSADFIRLVDRIAPQELHRTDVSFAGDGLSKILRGLLQRAGRLYLRHGWLAAPLVAAALLTVGVLAFLNNWRLRSVHHQRRATLHCSSVTICYRA